MDAVAVTKRVGRVALTCGDASAERSSLEAALRDITRVRSWLTAAEATLSKRLAAVASFPEKTIADCTRGSLHEATKTKERADTLTSVPSFADALGSGSVTAGHVDAITRAGKPLDEEQRAELHERVERLVGVASSATVEEFRRRLAHEVRAVQRDDGMERLERQRRAVRLRTWTDGDGMWCITARYDPLSGVRFSSRIDAELEAKFAQETPPTCPTDPVEKQQHLAALALADLIDGNGIAGRRGRSEVIAVIEAAPAPSTTQPRPAASTGDRARSTQAESTGGAPPSHDLTGTAPASPGSDDRSPAGDEGREPAYPSAATPAASPYDDRHAAQPHHPASVRANGPSSAAGRPTANDAGSGRSIVDAGGQAGPVIDWGIPVEIPGRVLAELVASGDAEVHPVVVRNGVVVYAPGELDLGRTTRLANRAQRRALQALYATCAVPGCAVRYSRCKLHHVVWWRNGGRTDLHNLLPLCAHHHARIHADGWQVTLGPNRELTIRLPDGNVLSTGPPSRRAA